jgi:acetoin utilization deacetylase AcuC-like enzyme
VKGEVNPTPQGQGEGASSFTLNRSPSLTAFVSHSDCARHDTGWNHPDHQGRLPLLVRAVYKDMLTLHGHLLDIEALPATEDDLRLVHTPDYLAELRDAVARAAAHGQPLALFEGGPIVSGASWDAALAATGTVLTGAEIVLRGDARSAFCMARPPGSGAGVDRTDGFSLVNHVAIAVRHLRQRRGIERVLVVEWAPEGGDTPTASILADDPGVRTIVIAGATAGAGSSQAGDAAAVTLPATAPVPAAEALLPAAFDALLADFSPSVMLLSAGFHGLEDDPVHPLAWKPVDYYGLTRIIDEQAVAVCGGRLVSVLDGGYSRSLGAAVVQHLRALAGLPAAG